MLKEIVFLLLGIGLGFISLEFIKKYKKKTKILKS